jgi:hypothetical protein
MDNGDSDARVAREPLNGGGMGLEVVEETSVEIGTLDTEVK